MTVLMKDATALLSEESLHAVSRGDLYDLLYADDTLICGTSTGPVQEFGAALERAGAMYGMSLNWLKTQALSVGTTERLRKPDGSFFPETEFIQYLGGLLSRDGRSDSELSRKIGTAAGDFKQLQRLWSHAGVSKKQKLQFFDAFVLSRLRYGLSSIWLVTAQRRRLDGFCARCYRRILRIPSAFVSRISNASVYRSAGRKPFSEQLLQDQLALLRRAAVSPVPSPMRTNTFVDDTLNPQIGRYVRRIGRPRQDWTSQLLREGAQRFGFNRFHALLQDTSEGADEQWKREVSKCFSSGA